LKPAESDGDQQKDDTHQQEGEASVFGTFISLLFALMMTSKGCLPDKHAL
jgi:hypothetical protein